MKCIRSVSVGRWVLLVGMIAGCSRGQATKPVDGRSVAEVEADFSATAKEMHETLTGLKALVDPVTRAEIAPKVIPLMAHLSADMDELGTLAPEKKELFAPLQQEYLMLRALLGDKPSAARLQEETDSKDSGLSLQGKMGQLLVRWIEDAKDPAAQAKLVDELETLAKAHPDSEELTDRLLVLSEIGPATPEMGERIEDVVITVMKNPLAEQAQMEILNVRRLKGMENKPLVIAGKQLDGKDFSTADWKGKVVLVDFWATWCGPCVAELPEVEKVFAEFHGKGLEIIGVSNDYAAADLTEFLGKNKDMKWPQLFDSAAGAQQEWNSITKGLGINAIPTMFLIDRKGILRSVEGGRDLEGTVGKLIGE